MLYKGRGKGGEGRVVRKCDYKSLGGVGPGGTASQLSVSAVLHHTLNVPIGSIGYGEMYRIKRKQKAAGKKSNKMKDKRAWHHSLEI